FCNPCINAQCLLCFNLMKIAKAPLILSSHISFKQIPAALFAVNLFCAQVSIAAERLEFTRMVAHWAGYGDTNYLPFIDDVKPEIAQVGFYGAHFWSLADTTSYGGYPANLPVRGHKECGAFFANLNKELHKRGVKVVGHLNV